MMRAVRFVRTLLYYDGVQLAIASDEVDQLYLSVLTTRAEDRDTFLLVPVSNERISSLVHAETDLHDAFVNPEVHEWFMLSLAEDTEGNLTPLEAPPESWLPSPGLHLPDLLEEVTEEEVVFESMKSGKTVLHLRLAPPESKTQIRIAADKLAQGLAAFQELVKQAYVAAVQELTGAEQTTVDEPYTMDVFAFSGGSFTVHMQSRQDADMLGHIEIDTALEKLDDLTEHLQDTEKAFQRAKGNHSSLIQAYKRLLRFVATSDSPLSYEWTSPERAPAGRKMTPTQADLLYERFLRQQELASEEILLRGVFFRANVESGKWAIHDDEGKSHHGEIAGNSTASLSGVVLGTERYELRCVERIHESGDGGTVSLFDLKDLRHL